MIELRPKQKSNTLDSMRINSGSVCNGIDKSEEQCAKHNNKQVTWQWREIVGDMIGAVSNTFGSLPVPPPVPERRPTMLRPSLP
jgi:hypothetical protein